jgi:paraquat-inducible protein B
MVKRVSPTLIGAFVLGGVALAVASVLLLGGREWFKRPLTCVMGFDGSVAGLTVEAPVSFRGVQVGKVASIELRPGTPVIVVVAHIDPSPVRGMPAGLTPARTERIIQDLVQQGLRAQLQIQSLVTGQLSVGLDYHRDSPATRVGLDEASCEIPTVPSAIADLHGRVKTILANAADIPLKDMAAAAARTLDAVEQLATEPDLRRLLTSLVGAARDARGLITRLDAQVDPTVTSLQRATAEAERTIDEVGRDVRRLVQHLDARIEPLAAAVGGTADSTRALVEDARRTLHELDARIAPTLTAFHEAAEATRDAMRELRSAGVQVNGLLDSHSPAAYQLADVLDQLGRTARVLRALGEDLERQPNLLLFGRGRSRGE